MAPCRKCEYCRTQQRLHWIGRCLAEQQTNPNVLFVTFTYGGGYDNEKAYWLDYRDLQLCFKKMRKGTKTRPGLNFKYVAVGEYGSKRDRAHFHAMMFFDGYVPNVELNKRVHYEPWTHGSVQFEYPKNPRACAVYLMDYLEKSKNNEAVLKYSKRPPIGQEYLIKYARDHARKGVALFQKGATFTIPGSMTRDNKLFKYPVGARTATYAKMVEAYVDTWVHARPMQPMPINEIMEEHLEEILDQLEINPLWVEYFKHHYGYVTDYGMNWKILWCEKQVTTIVYKTFWRIEVRSGEEVIWWHVEPKTSEEKQGLIDRQGSSGLAAKHATDQVINKLAPKYVREYIERNGYKLPPRS